MSRIEKPKGKRAVNRSKSTIMALEPRIMFDGAAMADVAEAVDAKAQSHPPADSSADAHSPAPIPVPVVSEQAPLPARSVVFIDAGVSDRQSLIEGAAPGVEVVVLDSDREAFTQMADYLAGRSGLDSIAVISHGGQGHLYLGGRVYWTEGLSASADALRRIGESLAPDGDILFYACKVGEGSEGRAFLDGVAALTGADVAASDDTTGNKNGGDWDLEVRTGDVATTQLFSNKALASFTGSLATIVVNSASDSNALTSATADGTVTFREAVAAVNAATSTTDVTVSGDGSDIIVFSNTLKGQTITLSQNTSSAALTISKGVTINGDVDGDNIADITFSGDLNGNSTTETTDARGLTFTGAGQTFVLKNANITRFFGGSAATQGAINLTAGTLTVDGCSIYNNLQNAVTAAANSTAFTIKNSIIRDNTSVVNGTTGYAPLRLWTTSIVENCVVANNTYTYNLSNASPGGAIWITRGLDYTATIRNTTVVGNVWTVGGAGSAMTAGIGIGLQFSTGSGSATVDVYNCIVADNTLGGVASNSIVKGEGAGATITLNTGNNFTGTTNGTTAAFVDAANRDYRPKAGATDFINTGNNANAASSGYDLRGMDRTRDGTVDLGAYEVRWTVGAPDVDLDTGTGGNDAAVTLALVSASTGVAVFPGPSVTQPDGDTRVLTATVTLAGGVSDTGNETLSLTPAQIAAAKNAGIAVTSSNGGQTLTLTGAASLASYQTVLGQIFYKNAAGSPTAGARSVTLTVNDGETTSTARTSTVTVGVAGPAISSATYDASTNVLTVTGTDLTDGGAIDVSKLTLTGQGGATYTLTSANVTASGTTSFSITLNAADQLNVEGLLNKAGTSAVDNTTFNLAAAADWHGTGNADTTGNGVTVSNVQAPTVTSATYDASTGSLVLTGTNMVKASGAANDITANKITLTGEGGATYTLTDTANVEITSATSATLVLSATDKAALNQIFNKTGAASTGGTTYNVAAADDWNTVITAGDISDATGNGVTVSNPDTPTITSATYDASTGTLVVTGTGFLKLSGAANDINVSKLTVTGEGGTTYTLTSGSVEITSGTSFTVTLNAADLAAVNQILNKAGTSATGAATYNLAAAEDWAAGAATAVNVADLAGNGITVSNPTTPTITSTAYDATTGVLTLTGTGFLKLSGAANDIVANKFTLTGEGGETYTLTDTANVDITSGTSATITLSAADKAAVNLILNKAGTVSTSGTTYNVAAAEDWAAGAEATVNVADATSSVTVSNLVTPTVTSATYDYATNTLVVTGTGFVHKSGGANDIDLTKLTLTGQGGATYTLTSATNVEVDSGTRFTVVLSGDDIQNVEALLNKDGTASAGGTAFNLAAAAGFLAGDATNAADATASVTVSNWAAPAITSSTFDWSSGQLVLTGTNFVNVSGAANDIVAGKFTFTGEGGTYTLTDTGNVEITSATSATITLSATDLLNVRGLLNKGGAASSGSVAYNLAAADDWMAGSPAASNIADSTTGVTVSNVGTPTITSATYDSTTGILTVTGTNLFKKVGAANDIDVQKLTLTGQGGGTYTIDNATADVEVTSATSFTMTLTGADKTAIDALLDQIGTQSSGGTTYNLAGADGWLAAQDSAANIADATNAVTVSINPTITSATYDASTGTLVVTGANIQANGGGADIDVSKITITGEGGVTYTLTSAGVERDSATQFTVTLNATDLAALNQIMNKAGTSSTGSTAFNIAAADDWCTNVTAGDTSDSTNVLTVSNPDTPTITSATYDASTGALVVTGTGFLKRSGAANDIDVGKLTIAGEGGATYQLTTNNVEITNGTSFTVMLNATDLAAVNQMLNKTGTTATGGATFNLAAAEDWAAGAAAAVNVADLTGNAITVSNPTTPTIASATYDHATGALVVTGTGFLKLDGAANDIVANKFTLTGAGGATYTLTDTANVDITSGTTFTLTLSATDKAAVNALMDASGTVSLDATTYNLAGAEDWNAGAAAAVTIADTTGNGITASNVPGPSITSATYDAATGQLVVTAVNVQVKPGAANDITASKFTFTGEGGATYTLTDSSDVERTSATAFTITLSATDKAAINQIMNKDGTASSGATTYNLAAADDWNANLTAGDTSDTTGNAITVSNVAVPTITGAAYDSATGTLVVTGTGLLRKAGAANDIDVSKFTVTGEGGEAYTLTTSSVEITSGTSFTIVLSAADKAALNMILNKNGTSSSGAGTYNLAAAEDWAAGADAAVNVADLTGNGITVSNVAAPTVTSATYDYGTGVLTVTGTGLLKSGGAANDIDLSKLTLSGKASGTYTLTSTDVEITGPTSFTVTLNAADKAALNLLLDANGTSSGGAAYNLAAAGNWNRGSAAAAADLTGNGVTVSGVPTPEEGAPSTSSPSTGGKTDSAPTVSGQPTASALNQGADSGASVITIANLAGTGGGASGLPVLAAVRGETQSVLTTSISTLSGNTGSGLGGGASSVIASITAPTGGIGQGGGFGGTGGTSAAASPVALAQTLSASSEGGSFRVAVVADSAKGRVGADIMVAKPIGQVEAVAGKVAFSVPADAFAVTSAAAQVQLTATRADGSPLPSWMKFNPATGAFEGTPPPGEKAVEVKVTARDSASGKEAAQVFKINLGGEGQGQPGQGRSGDAQPDKGKFAFAGKPGFSKQLAAARPGNTAHMMALAKALANVPGKVA